MRAAHQLLPISLKLLNSKDMHPESEAPPIIKKISHYSFDLSHKLGQGSFSQVYRGVDERTNSPVAVKKVRAGDLKSKIARRLLDCEVSILKVVSHPNIVKCREVCSSVNNCYLVTEMCEGGDLDAVLRKEGRMPQASIPKIILAVTSALLYLGRVGIVHRDVKVSNILIDGDTYKLADFGFAIQARRTFKDVAIGSPLYMSPEGLIHNLYGPKTDVWALGVLIYELTHSTTPLSRCTTEEELKSRVCDPPEVSPCLPEDLQELIRACLMVQESKRPTIQEIANCSYILRMGGLEEKDLTMTALSSCSSSLTEVSASVMPEVSYDSAVSLINYCRLVDKVSKLVPSEVLARNLLWWSVGLFGAKIRNEGVGPEKQSNLREIIRDYYEKYRSEYKDIPIKHVSLAEIRHECELKIEKYPTNSIYLKQLLKESEILLSNFDQGNLEVYAKKSRARSYANATPAPKVK